MADHKKNALLVLLRCHHNDGDEITYPDLSTAMGVGEKTKAWQCMAWKDLRSNNHVVNGSKPKTWKLSEEGLELAMSLCSPEELKDYRKAVTNDDHHDKIKSKLDRHPKDKAKKGSEIFEYFIEKNRPFTKDEVASRFNTCPDARGFFYGWQGLQKAGLVETCGKAPDWHKNYPDGEKVMKKRRLLGGTLYQLTDKAYLTNHRPELLEHVPKGSEKTTTAKKAKRAKHDAKKEDDAEEEPCNDDVESNEESTEKHDAEEREEEKKAEAA
mmetsp:Transcript_36955/g.89684  ORF Transcript_36955/g.89684 Transcript_36955/m.89684 type:complete len:269 (+) Transcript_36955:370-1176(+)|eukprot:CAMPEP_0113500812 /NCGR_PEP_ID=MMETSP0014_2-20120614/32563_1 /TAXON_ID=2857 /ORGANISM="Nitzschia sp." /LENGTH=268 /DNA_ID=CAMNT_0000395243 /DNA_START=955 /DNA_END=1761 /DNA_ORIENTATION=- /assembly_acc=CAM_ASM_000159